ncbi:AP-4 complex accessory subunit Tepsin [Mortierella sp. GBA35]|nr:AP-4 complex accessory subunit Tepsin [Mortierella sp. GBA35]
MNQLAESTKATINSLKAHALLSKALANDPKPTPGYLFPEIARLTQSSGTCTAVLSQLLKVISPTGYPASATSSAFIGQSNSAIPGSGTTTGQSSSPTAYASSPHVILKALKVLRQLAQSGSVEFRIQLARRGKGPLSEVVGYRGSWDEIHGDRLNEDIRSIAEGLIEYMHANPVQDHEVLEARQKWTDREASVMQSSTQGLPGYGNPDYEDSDSEDDARRTKAVLQEKPSTAKLRKKTEKKREDVASPPLPGFGNPEFEQQSPQSEATLMSKLVDRLQDLTAPPPPMAMRAAYRQQEQRRQKLFVGEYSMNNSRNSSSTFKDGSGGIVMMGTNPFKRTHRVQGFAAEEEGHRPAVWGVAGEVCDVVVEGMRQETLISLEEPHQPHQDKDGDMDKAKGSASTQPTVPVITGVLRDMVEWIEQETWERRLRYLFVMDALLAHRITRPEVMSCSALPVLSKTLTGQHCQLAPQASVQALSRHLAEYINQALRHTLPSLTTQTSRNKDPPAPAITLPDVMLLDIGA